MAFAFDERLLDVTAQFVFQWIGANHVGAAKIRFPLCKNRAKVEEHDVVLSDGQVRRILIVGRVYSARDVQYAYANVG